MEIQCKFKYVKLNSTETTLHYTCQIENWEFPESKNLIFNEPHIDSKSHDDVNFIWIRHCEMTKIPQGLTKIFPNLKVLYLQSTNLNKIDKIDLDEYKQLEVFFCQSSPIEFLAANLFEEFANLQKLSFNGCKLKIIEPTIFDALRTLNYVDLRGNEYFDCFYSANEKSKGTTLERIKAELFKKFFALDEKEIRIFLKRYAKKIKKLKDSNVKLRVMNQNLEELKNELKKSLATSQAEVIALKITDQKSKQEMEQITDYVNKLSKEVEMTQKFIDSRPNLKFKSGLEKLSPQKSSTEPRSSLNVDIEKFLNDQNFKDLRIQIDDQEFKVHKFLLAARSPTLADIFLANPDAENLNLLDISVETFEKILNFMYTDELPGDDEVDFLNLFSAASRLDIQELKNFAVVRVLNQINEKNGVEALIVGNKYKHYQIRQKGFDEIKKIHPDVPDNWIDKPEKVRKFIEVFGEC